MSKMWQENECKYEATVAHKFCNLRWKYQCIRKMAGLLALYLCEN